MRRRGRALIAGLAIAGLAVSVGTGTSGASTTITNFVPVSATGADVADPQVAVAPNGSAYYAWVRFNGSVNVIQTAFVSTTGVVSSPNTVSLATENASSPRLATAPDGSAIVVWQQIETDDDILIRSQHLTAGGGLGAGPHFVSDQTDDHSQPDVAIGPGGTAIYTWVDLSGATDQLDAVAEDASHNFGAIEDVAFENLVDYSEPQVEVVGNGDAVIAFRANDGVGDFEISFNRRLANGTYTGGGNGIDASDTTNNINRDEVDLATTPVGDAVITWRENIGAVNQIKARRFEPDDSPTAGVVDVSAAGQTADQAQVDMDNVNSRAVIAWRRNNGSFNIIQERYLVANGTLQPTQDLSLTGANADQPQVAIDTLGRSTFVWRRGTDVQTRGKANGGNLTPIQDLTTADSNTEPRIAVNVAGVRWGAFNDASNDQVRGFFDLTPPGIPAPPTITGSNPSSPADDNNPEITGNAEPGSSVLIIAGAGCDGPVVADGSAATFASPGITVAVPDNSTTTFSARASHGFGSSACSAAGVTYTEATPPPVTPKKKCKKGLKLKKGKCKRKKKRKK
jgi:hypothetical protein